MNPRNARAEAQTIVGPQHHVRVLEPSPPVNGEEPFFADDPVSDEDARDGAQLIVPTGVAGDLSWNDWLESNPQHGEWAAGRWLGGLRRMPATPASLSTTREGLHRLAMYVIAPVRHSANGKFGLRYTFGGFGTPFFGDDRQVRVKGSLLIDQRGDSVRAEPITTLQAAADFLECEIDADLATEPDSPPVGDTEADLGIDEAASAFIGDWFGFAFAVLEAVRAEPKSTDASRPQVWPGHLDPAIEVGDEDHRASYGASVGDAGIDEPYLYVAPWSADKAGIDVSDPLWNADGFAGAVLRHSDLPSDADPVDRAVDFMLAARDRIG